MDRGAWPAIVHGVAKSCTWSWHAHTCMYLNTLIHLIFTEYLPEGQHVSLPFKFITASHHHQCFATQSLVRGPPTVASHGSLLEPEDLRPPPTDCRFLTVSSHDRKWKADTTPLNNIYRGTNSTVGLHPHNLI